MELERTEPPQHGIVRNTRNKARGNGGSSSWASSSQSMARRFFLLEEPRCLQLMWAVFQPSVSDTALLRQNGALNICVREFPYHISLKIKPPISCNQPLLLPYHPHPLTH